MNNKIYALSRAMALFGAAVLVAIAIMSVVSIVGRAFSFAGLGPIPGDFELVEAGTALVVFCFMPWCHLKMGHASVDMLWNAYPPAMKKVLTVLSDALMLLIWIVLIWRMGVSTLEYRDNGETTFILHMPVWFGYAASMVPAVFGCLVYGWRFLEDIGLATPPAGFTTSAGAH